MVTKNLVSGSAVGDAARAQGVARATGGSAAGETVAVLRAGHAAFAEVSAAAVRRFPAIWRGTNLTIFESELRNYVADHFVGRDAATLEDPDVFILLDHCEKWFGGIANPCTTFIPCAITRWQAPRFSIGSFDFIFVDDVAQSVFYLPPDLDDVGSRAGVDKMLKLMRDIRVYWLACVPVDRCEQHRAEEIGSLTVDLAIIALQIAWSNFSTRTMSRLDSRRGEADKFTVSKAGSFYNCDWTNMDAGMAIGPEMLADLLQRHSQEFEAVGNCVRSFASGRFRLPSIEQARCDAAYWLHEALAEPIESIAIAKLETALEVLLRAGSNSGSKRRMLTALDLFFGLKPDDPILPGSPTTAEGFARDVTSDRALILQGTSSTLNSRMARNRSGLEGFAITVVRRPVLELEQYARSPAPKDSIDHYLSWIKGRPRA